MQASTGATLPAAASCPSARSVPGQAAHAPNERFMQASKEARIQGRTIPQQMGPYKIPLPPLPPQPSLGLQRKTSGPLHMRSSMHDP